MSSDQQRFGSIWDALGESPENAEDLKCRSDLMIALAEHICANGWTRAQAARAIDVEEGQIDDLLDGNIDKFSKEMLQAMANTARTR